nr:short chain dehydrogenase [Cladonia metacorallifera]
MPPNPAAAGFNFTSTLRNDTYPAIDPIKMDLRGKCVFVSGASKGVGRAAAISFVKAGVAAIAIAARSDLSSLEREMHEAATAAGKPMPHIKSIHLDILDPQSVERAMEEFKSTLDSDPDQWWQTWSVNVRGTFLLTRALLPLMLKGGDKQIVMLSSIGAFMPTAGGSGYQISKLVLLRYTEYLNIEYGAQGVVAYGLHPGAIPTELALTMPKYLHAKLIDTPELAADTIVFLVSEKREWLRGRYVSCTWDMPEFLEKQEEIVSEDKLKIRLVL